MAGTYREGHVKAPDRASPLTPTNSADSGNVKSTLNLPGERHQI